MYTGQTVSLKQIMWKVMNNKLASDVSYEDAAEFAIEAIKLIGAPLQYKSVVSPPIKIQDHKALTPNNIISVIGARAMENCDDDEVKTYAMTYATDSFHADLACREENNCPTEFGAELTYTIEGGIITTAFKEGYVQISYKTLQVDEDNFPLIPDDTDTKLAIEYYILFRYLEPLWLMGKITDKAFNYIDTKKCWYIGAAGTSLTLQGPDHLEAVMNTVNRLIVNSNAHKSFFKLAGKKEEIRRYN